MKSRRNFLKVAGVGIAGSLVKPVSSTATSTHFFDKKIKIGVLIPQSNHHPQYPESFLNGIRLALKSNSFNIKTELITEQVKIASPYLVKNKIKQLKSENNVDIVIALVNTNVGLEIGGMAKEHKLPVLIANAGENYPAKNIQENPYLFCNTLNLFQNAYLSGEYAVKQFGKKVAVITSQYDSGYDALFSFYKGVEAAGGNEVKTFLKKQEEIDFINKTLDKIEKSDINSLYVYLNGHEAGEFFRKVKNRNLNLPILTTSFVADDSQLPHLGHSANNLLNFSSWNKNLNTSANQVFVNDYVGSYSKYPDQFGFLGFESALLIQNALEKCSNNYSGKNIADNLIESRVNSPGGNISINKKTGYVQNPVYLNQTKKAFSGIFENNKIDNLYPINESDKTFLQLESELRSGNSNPYLFV